MAQATKGFTDWSCPPDAKQRTFVMPIDDGYEGTYEKQFKAPELLEENNGQEYVTPPDLANDALLVADEAVRT